MRQKSLDEANGALDTSPRSIEVGHINLSPFSSDGPRRAASAHHHAFNSTANLGFNIAHERTIGGTYLLHRARPSLLKVERSPMPCILLLLLRIQISANDPDGARLYDTI